MSQDDTDLKPADSTIRIVRNLLAERSIFDSISENDDLRAAGLSSLDMVTLVLSLEAELNLQIPEKFITPANFRSVSAIDTLIRTLRD